VKVAKHNENFDIISRDAGAAGGQGLVKELGNVNFDKQKNRYQ